jgi:hypothetical protein
VTHIPSYLQFVDVFTKALTSSLFKEFRYTLQIRFCSLRGAVKGCTYSVSILISRLRAQFSCVSLSCNPAYTTENTERTVLRLLLFLRLALASDE